LGLKMLVAAFLRIVGAAAFVGVAELDISAVSDGEGILVC